MRVSALLLLLTLTWPGTALAARLRLTWDDNSDNEAGFQIERRMETEDTFTPIATVGMNISAYVEYRVDAGTIYCYQVRAFNAEGDSAPSNEVCDLGH